MKELIENIGSYNLFNYLLPGILFVYVLNVATSFNLDFDNMLAQGFISYFIGMVISRIGSLVIEPILIKIQFIHFKPHSEYSKAEMSDPKLVTISEQNNVYRTMISLILNIVLVCLLDILIITFPELNKFVPYLISIILLVIFVVSYRKQTKYIFSRINESQKKG
jgi:hypothetical protein